MFTKRFTTKVTNLEQQNIRAIPFDEYYKTCVVKFNEEKAYQQEVINRSWEHQRETKVKTLTRDLGSQLESSEGIEEAVRETDLGSPPELSPEVLRKIVLDTYKGVAEGFAEKYTLKARASWLPPQLMAHFGAALKPVKVDGEESKYSPEATVAQLLGSADEWTRGAFLFVKFAKRGDWVDVQYKEPGSYYSAIVPFFLAAIKKSRNIKYSEWDRTTLSAIVEPQLCEAMLCEVPEGLDTEELLKIREVGMQIKTGKNAGGHRNPLTTYKLWGCQASLVGDLPWLAQVMLTQIWCAHPEARNAYAVLDPRDWDATPERLISTDIFKKPEAEVKAVKSFASMVKPTADIPW